MLVLRRHASADPQQLSRIKQHLSRGATLVLTPAVVRMMGKPLADLSGVTATTVAIIDKSGKVLASVPVPALKAPLDLFPKTITVTLTVPN